MHIPLTIERTPDKSVCGDTITVVSSRTNFTVSTFNLIELGDGSSQRSRIEGVGLLK